MNASTNDIQAKRIDFLTRKLLPLLSPEAGWILSDDCCRLLNVTIPTQEAESEYVRQNRTLAVGVFEVMAGTFRSRGTGRLHITLQLGHGRGSDYNRVYQVKADGSFNVKKLLATIEEFKARAKADKERHEKEVVQRENKEANRKDTRNRFRAAFPGSFEGDFGGLTINGIGTANVDNYGGKTVDLHCYVKNPETLKAIIALLNAEVAK